MWSRVGACELARIRRAVRVPAVDQLSRPRRALDRRELAHELGARAGAAAVAALAVDGADVDRAAGLVVRAGRHDRRAAP
jgi:hypothetical protein